MTLTQRALNRCYERLGHTHTLTPDQVQTSIRVLASHINLSPPDEKADELKAIIARDDKQRPVTAFQLFEIVAEFPFLSAIIRDRLALEEA